MTLTCACKNPLLQNNSSQIDYFAVSNFFHDWELKTGCTQISRLYAKYRKTETHSSKMKSNDKWYQQDSHVAIFGAAPGQDP